MPLYSLSANQIEKQKNQPLALVSLVKSLLRIVIRKIIASCKII